MTIWWLSYSDGRVPMGVCVVRAETFALAALEARRLGISPGGEVMGFDAPPEEEAALEPHVGKFLSLREAEALGGVVDPAPS